MDVASIIGAVAGLLAAFLSVATWLSARAAKAKANDVDAIRVTQDVMAETIEAQRQDNANLRQQLQTLTAEHAQCQRRIAQIMRKLRQLGVEIDE